MLADETVGRKDNPRCCSLWRFMIDAKYQPMGSGTNAFLLVVEHVRSHPLATMLITSHIAGNRSAEHFYLKFGFRTFSGPTAPGEIRVGLRPVDPDVSSTQDTSRKVSFG
jgi:GNAT superfamily N-acetyltransferase